MAYRSLIRPILFRMDPERAHHLALGALRFASALAPLRSFLAALYRPKVAGMSQEIWGLHFEHPVGLAAGFDKDARVVPALQSLGFAFVEVGAISSQARPGNPRPRIFRLPADRALINRMGLPNDGARVIASRLEQLSRPSVPIFANIVKTADLEGDAATMAADYVETLEAVLPWVDGFTVNISCPATPNLRTLGQQDAMFELLKTLGEARDRGVRDCGGARRPLILKVSPDVDDAEAAAIVAASKEGLLDGLVLTNSTTTRPSSLAAPSSVTSQKGGLSGQPLFAIALSRVRHFAAATEGQIPIIAVGGISNAGQARAMLDAGASLVEVLTAFVYEGPGLVKSIATGLESGGWRPMRPDFCD